MIQPPAKKPDAQKYVSIADREAFLEIRGLLICNMRHSLIGRQVVLRIHITHHQDRPSPCVFGRPKAPISRHDRIRKN